MCVCVSCAGVPDKIDHSRIETTPISLTSIQVQFPTPIDNNTLITGYMYMLCEVTCTNAATPRTVIGQVVAGNYTAFTIDGLIPNSVYILRVATVNEAGNGLTPIDDADAHTFNSSTCGV